MNSVHLWPYLMVGLVAALLVLVFFDRSARRRPHRLSERLLTDHERHFYLLSKRLLTDNERHFYGVLLRAFPDCVVLTQVSMGALIGVRDGLTKEQSRRLGLMFGAKIVDFVVCRQGSLEVIALIELDDQMHDRERDRRRDLLTAEVGYRTFRYESRWKPRAAEVRSQVLGTPAQPV